MIASEGHELFLRLIERSRTFVLTTHMNPDGDAIGSQLGLARFLASRGGEVRLVNQDPTPVTLLFLEDETLCVEVFDEVTHGPVLSGTDLILLLDNSVPDRLGRMEQIMRASADRVLCVDHHPTRVSPWAENILDEDACATASIVYDLIRNLGWNLDRRIAEALFVGIATDTGFFRFNSTTTRAYEIAAELMRAGVNPARCYQEIYERNSVAYTRLLGYALTGLRLDADGAVASVRITRDREEQCGAKDEDTSEMTTVLLALDRVRVAILIREMEGGQIKVSLRSKGDLDVRLLASEFGGGGHRNASGIVLEGDLDEVAEKVIARASDLTSQSL